MVYEASKGCGEIERKRIEEGLRDIKRKLVRQSRLYDSNTSWLGNAESEHQRQAFRAIIALSNPRRTPAVLSADECEEESGTSPLWCVPRSISVPRSAVEMARQATPLLKISTQILFIDPYFNPDELKFRKPLQEFVRVLVTSRPLTRLEYHLSADHKSAPSAPHFRDLCNRKLPQLLPIGTKLRLIRWNQRSDGREFHARYIVTERGGISFDPGLDTGGVGELTTLSLLEPERSKQVWRDFEFDSSGAPLPSTYEFSDETVIDGTSEARSA